MFNQFLRRPRIVASLSAAVSSVAVAGFSYSPSSSDADTQKQHINENVVILSGTANRKLSDDIAKLLKISLIDAETKRFSDGEINCVINESIRGKDVFIVQTCAAPVNDNIMELLLTVAAARRAGAQNVTTVIPYFGYKYHRRGMPISTTYNSRFLWSAASDLAKMLQTVGVDNVVSVDLQRPGQGHEATFFAETIPVETINTSQIFTDYFATQIQPPLQKVVVVSANSECVKKARKFTQKLKDTSSCEEVDFAVFIGDASQKPSANDLLGDVNGADVIIIDDIIGKGGVAASWLNVNF
jgi:ribose-phosphate pyrophosphokinase